VKKLLSIMLMLTVSMLTFSMGAKNYDAAKVRKMSKSPKVLKLVNKLEAFLVTEKGAKKALNEKSYVGSHYCLACHPDENTWVNTMHATGLKALKGEYSLQNKKGVVADYNGNGVDDFMEGYDLANTAAFAKYGTNAPKLGYSENTGYTIQIGEMVYTAKFAYGGSGKYKQRYITQPMSADGMCAGHYVLPVQYNEKTDEYVTYHTDKWYGDDDLPLYDSSSVKADFSHSNSFDKGCSGCHYTHIEKLYQTADGEWVAVAPQATLVPEGDTSYVDLDGNGIPDEINTGCEKCHSGGSLHILGGGDPSQIINPADWTAEQQTNLCGYCHSRGHSLPDGIFSFPFDETNWETLEIGENPSDIYSDGGGYWGDATNSKQHHQQFYDLKKSAHYTNPYHKISCINCHDPHTWEASAIVNEAEITNNGELLGSVPVENDDNSLCLSCHASYAPFDGLTKEMMLDFMGNTDAIAKSVVAHTNHPYAPTRSMGLSRCSKCHMPKVAKSAINYDIHSHTFEAISPQKTLDYVMPNSCAASCHSQKVNTWGLGLDPTISDWSEDFDVTTATKLKYYFGESGEWWNTSEE